MSIGVLVALAVPAGAGSGDQNPTAGLGQELQSPERTRELSDITRADFGFVNHTSRGTCLIEGTWAPRRAAWDAGQWYEYRTPYPTIQAASPWNYYSGKPDQGYNACATQQTNNSKTHIPTTVAGSGSAARPSAHNAAVFGVQVAGTGYRYATMQASLYGASIWLDDRDRPRVLSAPDTPWRDSGNADVSFRARDDVINSNTTPVTTGPDSGLGIRSIELLDIGTSPTTTGRRFFAPSGAASATDSSTTCTGTNHAPCPADATATLPIDTTTRAEGVTYAYGVPNDALGKQGTTAGLAKVRVDRSKPELDFRGSTLHQGGQVLSEPSYDLKIKAADGSTTSPAAERSGVASVEVAVRRDTNLLDELTSRLTGGGFVVKETKNGECAPAASSCPVDMTYEVKQSDFRDQDGKLQPGEYTIRVRARDRLYDDVPAGREKDHQTEQLFTVVIPRESEPERSSDRLALRIGGPMTRPTRARARRPT